MRILESALYVFVEMIIEWNLLNLGACLYSLVTASNNIRFLLAKCSVTQFMKRYSILRSIFPVRGLLECSLRTPMMYFQVINVCMSGCFI